MIKKIQILLILLLSFTTATWGKQFTLVIDPGHGGHDAGAIGAISKEKNINLNVALAFGRYVERNCPDVKVIYTRKTDVFIPLHTRADIANKAKADLFISIHTNSLPAGRIARGLETYTLGMHRAADNLDVAKRENSVILIEKDYKQRYEGFDPRSSESYIMFEFMQDKNMAQSVELARYVQQRVCASAGRPNKGVKQAGFLVLRETSMPSCLIELGFISTTDEEQFLNSDSGIDQMGKGIYQAFLDYKRKYDTNITVPYRAEKTPEVTIPKAVDQQPMNEGASKMKEKGGKKKEKEKETVKKDEPAVVKDDVDAAKDNPVVAKEEQKKAATDSLPAAPVFKVQILANNKALKTNDVRFKKQTDIDCYEEGGMYKYTVGASTNYNDIARLRKELLEKFPEAFVVAFRNGQRMNVVEAINEFKKNKK